MAYWLLLLIFVRPDGVIGTAAHGVYASHLECSAELASRPALDRVRHKMFALDLRCIRIDVPERSAGAHLLPRDTPGAN